MRKLRTKDEVIVLSGRDRGKRGKILSVLDENRLVVDDVNLVKKHTKPNPNKGETGGIVEKEAPIDISNVAIYNPATDKADRVGIKVLEDGKKVRYFKSNNEVIDI